MEELKLNLNNDEFNRILQNDSSLAYFLMSLFTNKDSESSGKIADQLLRYYSSEEGNPQIEAFSLHEAKYDPVSKTGVVSFKFQVKYWFSCSSLAQEQSGQETIKFKINGDQTSMTLMFPKLEERSTHEEF